MEILTNPSNITLESLQKELVVTKELIAKQETLINELSTARDDELKAICHQLASPVQVISMSIEFYLMKQQTPSKDSLLRIQNATSTLVKTIEEIRSNNIIRLKSFQNDIVT